MQGNMYALTNFLCDSESVLYSGSIKNFSLYMLDMFHCLTETNFWGMTSLLKRVKINLFKKLIYYNCLHTAQTNKSFLNIFLLFSAKNIKVKKCKIWSVFVNMINNQRNEPRFIMINWLTVMNIYWLLKLLSEYYIYFLCK